MGRISRVIVPGCPHHVVQRGNRRQKVFFHENDKRLYLRILNHFCRKEGVEIWCYCLMDNHVHLIAVPSRNDSLQKAIGEIHRRYTWLINIRENWKGHLWQGRFFSYPLDDDHLYLAVRYIERNPVRAGLVERAEDYPWSSAKAHLLGNTDEILTDFWLMTEIDDWGAYLRENDREEDIIKFRKHEKTGRPLGNEAFISKIEKITGRILRPMKPGRPKKS
jgi:putative transposase